MDSSRNAGTTSAATPKSAAPYADLRDACDAAATAAENAAFVFRQRAAGFEITDYLTLLAVAHGFEQFAVEMREISSGEGVVRSTEPVSPPIREDQ